MTKIKGKCIYWADPMISEETVEMEYEKHVKTELEENGIEFETVTCMDIPPYNENFQFLLFDYGGLLPGCDSLLQTNCRWLMNNAADNPSRFYIMVSAFTEQAMRDEMADIRPEKNANIFMNIKKFTEYIKQTGESS